MLVGYFYHAVADYTVFVHVTLLELFYYDVLSDCFIFHMHHCIMKIRIEFISYGFDSFYSHAVQCGKELLVDFFHSLYERIFFVFCILMTIIGSFLLYGILYAVNGYPSLMGTAFSTYYISLSIFLGFAISFPDMQVLLYFIIPIKIKWLAYLDVALLAYSMITSIMSGNWAGCVVILCSLANVLVFFLMTRKGKRGSFQQNRRRKEFKKAVSRGEAEYRNPNGITKHKCAICGRTEKDDPNLEFRFCSRCNGNYEYCQDHLFTHEHVK